MQENEFGRYYFNLCLLKYRCFHVDLCSIHTYSKNMSTKQLLIKEKVLPERSMFTHIQTWQGAIVAEYGGRVVSNLDHTEKEAMKYLKRVYPEVYTEFTRHCRTLSDIDGESDGLRGWLF